MKVFKSAKQFFLDAEDKLCEKEIALWERVAVLRKDVVSIDFINATIALTKELLKGNEELLSKIDMVKGWMCKSEFDKILNIKDTTIRKANRLLECLIVRLGIGDEYVLKTSKASITEKFQQVQAPYVVQRDLLTQKLVDLKNDATNEEIIDINDVYRNFVDAYKLMDEVRRECEIMGCGQCDFVKEMKNIADEAVAIECRLKRALIKSTREESEKPAIELAEKQRKAEKRAIELAEKQRKANLKKVCNELARDQKAAAKSAAKGNKNQRKGGKNSQDLSNHNSTKVDESSDEADPSTETPPVAMPDVDKDDTGFEAVTYKKEKPKPEQETSLKPKGYRFRKKHQKLVQSLSEEPKNPALVFSAPPKISEAALKETALAFGLFGSSTSIWAPKIGKT